MHIEGGITTLPPDEPTTLYMGDGPILSDDPETDEPDTLYVSVSLALRCGSTLRISVTDETADQMAADFVASPVSTSMLGRTDPVFIGHYEQSDGTPLVVRWDAVEVMY